MKRYVVPETTLPVGTLSATVIAHPLLPFPPEPAPGTPLPAYESDALIQPFNVLAVLIAVPGAAKNKPDILPVNVTLKFCNDPLVNAPRKY